MQRWGIAGELFLENIWNVSAAMQTNQTETDNIDSSIPEVIF